MKNCTTKSVILAPFNSTRSHIALEEDENNGDDAGEERPLPPLEIDENLIVDKKIIKYAPRVKDINR